MTTERLDKATRSFTLEQHRSRQGVSALVASNWLPVCGLTLLAFLIRIVMLRFSWGMDGDGVWYATLGKNLVAGNLREGLSTYWPPLYPLLVGVSSLAIHDLEFAGKFVSVLAGSLLVIPVYYLCLKLYGKEPALIAGLLVAIHALLITYSTSLMADSTYTLLLTSAIVLGLFALSKARGILFFSTGAAFGACYLVRPEAMGYIGLITLLALAGKLYNNRVTRKKLILNSVVLVTGFVLLAAPYVLYLHHRTGTWTISEKLAGNLSGSLSTSELNWRHLTPDGQATRADILWGGFRPENTGPPQSQALPAKANSGSRGISSKLAQIVMESGRRLPWVDLRFRQIVSPVFIVLVGLGLFTARWSKADAASHIYLLLFGLATVFGYSLTVLQDRYLLPLFPLIICWSAAGVIALETWLVESLNSAHKSTAEFFRRTRLGSALIIATLFVSMLPSFLNLVRHEDYPPRTVAAWIKEHSGPATLIMASGPWPAFLAGGKHLYLPNEEYPVVTDYALRKGVRYLVIEEQMISKTPHLKFLLDEQDQHPNLKLVHKFDRLGAKVLVFEVTPSLTSVKNGEPADSSRGQANAN